LPTSLGDFDKVKGIGLNQQGLYSSFDAVAACWSHKSGVIGSGSWNFGCRAREDNVEILGSKGSVKFSVFDEKPIRIADEREIAIETPDPIQLFHVRNMARHLFSGTPHPSIGISVAHTAWVMDGILGRVGE